MVLIFYNLAGKTVSELGTFFSSFVSFILCEVFKLLNYITFDLNINFGAYLPCYDFFSQNSYRGNMFCCFPSCNLELEKKFVWRWKKVFQLTVLLKMLVTSECALACATTTQTRLPPHFSHFAQDQVQPSLCEPKQRKMINFRRNLSHATWSKVRSQCTSAEAALLPRGKV